MRLEGRRGDQGEIEREGERRGRGEERKDETTKEGGQMVLWQEYVSKFGTRCWSKFSIYMYMCM